MSIQPIDRRRYETQLPEPTRPATTDASARRELLPADYPDYPPPRLASLGLCSVEATPIQPKTTGEKLDDLAAAYAGPYQVGGSVVTAPPMFKLATPYPSQTQTRALGGIVGAELAARAQSSQGGPRDIQLATQKLIDAGKLPTGAGDVATRIKQMQWDYGVGIDCASYTHHALLAATGKTDAQLGLGSWEAFRGLDANRHFTKVNPSEIAAGDVITLDPKPPETIGHNVIARSAFTTDRYPGMPGNGPFRVITVDSSWGAGSQGSATGGYRRDTWVHDAATHQWGFFRPGSTALRISSEGPADLDRFHGAYRVKP